MTEKRNPYKHSGNVTSGKEPDSYPPEYKRTTMSTLLRGCGIALGIAAVIFLFIVGACFISLSRW